MILDINHPLHKKVVLVDTQGKIVPMVQSWDTEKEEAIIIVGGRPYDGGKFRATIIEGGNMAFVKAHLPGCHLIYKDTKERVPDKVLGHVGS